MERLVQMRLDAEPGSELDQMLLREMREREHSLRSLQVAHNELATMRVEGLSSEEAASLVAFTVEVCAGINAVTSAERRRIYQILQLTAQVSRVPEAIKLGQRHHYSLEWRAAIPIHGRVRDANANALSTGTTNQIGRAHPRPLPSEKTPKKTIAISTSHHRTIRPRPAAIWPRSR